jgi:HK97 family phage prohead protease
MAKTEFRNCTELRAESQGDEFAISGYGARFNSPSKPIPTQNGHHFIETIKPGAFTRALAEQQDVFCLINHDMSRILGRTKSGTLTLAQDDKGLKFRCQLDRANSDHRNIHAAIARRDIDACSFGFIVSEDDFGNSWHTDKDGVNQRTIGSFRKITDVSVVSSPAYNDTSVDARSVSSASRKFVQKLFPSERSKFIAIANRQAREIAEQLVANPLVRTALRNKVSVSDLEMAELRLKAREPAKELCIDEDEY